MQNGPPKLASEFTVKGGEKVNIQIEGIEVRFTINLFSFLISFKTHMVPVVLSSTSGIIQNN